MKVCTGWCGSQQVFHNNRGGIPISGKYLIKTLGGFQIIKDGEPIQEKKWKSQKALELLRFLVANRSKKIPVDRIFEYLWPGMNGESAKANLHSTLHTIRKVAGFNSDVLSVRGESIRFIPENMEVDVDVFEKLIRLAESSKDMNEREKLLRSAVELYKGDFLPEDIYEDWSTPYREYYRELYIDALRNLCRILMEKEKYTEVKNLARKLVSMDPYNEEAYYTIIMAYFSLGRLNDARRWYQKLEKTLKEDLGIYPSRTFEELLRIQRDFRSITGRGALIVGKGLFNKITFYESRKRKPTSILLSLTFVSEDNKLPDLKGILTELSRSLRKGDVLTLDVNNISILLNETRKENAEEVVKSIVRRIKERPDMKNVRILYEWQCM